MSSEDGWVGRSRSPLGGGFGGGGSEVGRDLGLMWMMVLGSSSVCVAVRRGLVMDL